MNALILERLARGETIENHREPGNSMAPLIRHREPVTLAPVDASKLERGDIVLAKVRGRFFTHKVSAVQGDKVQIANNHGRVNGWTSRRQVYAIVTAVNGVPRLRAAEKVLHKD
ncbi:MAG: hypothetical protein WCT10_00880 [Patescibacteria group bacterium]|jgi:hypothetical protein